MKPTCSNWQQIMANNNNNNNNNNRNRERKLHPVFLSNSGAMETFGVKSLRPWSGSY